MFRWRRRTAAHLAWAVIATQAGFLLALWWMPDPPASGWRALELWWASARRPVFYVLPALALAGPVLSGLALRVPGPHRVWLILAWAGFLAVLLGIFSEHLMVMLRVIWWQVNR